MAQLQQEWLRGNLYQNIFFPSLLKYSELLSMFGKLFGKKDQFFLELKDDDKKTQEAPVEAVTIVRKTQEAPVEAVAIVETPVKVEPKPKKTSIKKNKAPAPEVALPTPVTPKPEPTEVSFASDYLIVPTLSRRKPGPSLNAYKQMARQAKLPVR
jgi:hypothetical protein